MSDIKIPQWALPIGAAIIPAAIAWGAMQAQAEATNADVERIEKIVIALIDNSKKEREQNREHFNSIFQRLDSLVDVLVKLTGNGLRNKDKDK